jgi:DHA2 family multidrug resistance protein
MIVSGVMLAALLQTVDATIVNVALPTIQGNLGATIDEATWVVTSYVIANVIVIPIAPWLQTRFGRKRYFLVSIVGFTLASVLCGLSSSLNQLIAFRLVQGAFGGGLLATAQVVLRDTFPPDKLGTSQAIFSLGAVLGPSIGPTLGGYLTDHLSWPWAFDINIAPGFLATIILLVYLRPGVKPVVSGIDYVGVLLLVAAIGSLQYVLDEGQRADWFQSTRIVLASVLAFGAATSFVIWELLGSAAPVVDVRILRRIGVAVASMLAMVNAISVYGVLLLLPQFVTTRLSFSATDAGLLIGVRALPIALLTIPIGRLMNSRRLDLRALVGFGFVVSACGSLWLAKTTTSLSDFTSLLAPMALSGFGIAFIYSPLLVAALRFADANQSAKAASFVTLALQLGGSLSSAALVTLVDRRSQWHETILAASANAARPVVVEFLKHHAVRQLDEMVRGEAQTLAYADAFIAVACLTLSLCPMLIFMRAQQK